MGENKKGDKIDRTHNPRAEEGPNVPRCVRNESILESYHEFNLLVKLAPSGKIQIKMKTNIILS